MKTLGPLLEWQSVSGATATYSCWGPVFWFIWEMISDHAPDPMLHLGSSLLQLQHACESHFPFTSSMHVQSVKALFYLVFCSNLTHPVQTSIMPRIYSGGTICHTQIRVPNLTVFSEATSSFYPIPALCRNMPVHTFSLFHWIWQFWWCSHPE